MDIKDLIDELEEPAGDGVVMGPLIVLLALGCALWYLIFKLIF